MNLRNPRKVILTFVGLLSLVISSVSSLSPTLPVKASHTPDPASVTIAGSLQAALGCPGDWAPDCAVTHLGYDPDDDVWQASFSVPAGSYEYKAALNDSWDENYGANAQPNGSNIGLVTAGTTSVKFYYDHKSHWVTDAINSAIATLPGSFQSELGCAGDWDPGCLRSWLQDPDGDGTYIFETAALPAGAYEAKVAINEGWDVNYGAGGVLNGPNIPFTVSADSQQVVFTYNSTSHILTIQAGHGPDNNIEWDGLRHDSRDTLYRSPGGAIPAGTPVTLRLRTFHNDVTAVKLRVYDINANGQQIVPMLLAATGVSCYQPELENDTCDYWQASLPNDQPNNLWYRFIVSDGDDTDYYADNTPALDGGMGNPSEEIIDNSYALMVFDPAFSAPSWASNAVIYQIFPDRFRNGRKNNDPRTGDIRYDDPVLALPWGTLPEGFCRNYADGDTNCPWRFDTTPPDYSPTKESPRGRDYMGGDLKGVEQMLDYLKSIGVTAIYFNPVFDAGSNHSYDTQDYYKIDPYFGTQKDWENLVKGAKQHGMRIILDGVFNHLSSDSPIFDRYHHYPTVGACESADSPYRDWFQFRAPSGSEPSVCAPSSPGGSDTFYDGWFGFDSIPVINKSNPEVQEYFLSGENSVSRYWLKNGAGAWRMDVMGDASFPAGYWEDFRQIVKETRNDALIIGELWQKDSTLLRFLRGDRADTTMNYRLRDAVLGLLAPGPFDSKGFADSGRILSPSEFAARISSIREDYPDAAFYSLMNLVDSHDTERILWTLTPGVETQAEKELNASNLAQGKLRQMIASLIQFTMPGAPTVFYGDEVGQTGDDDPDDRRTFPWADLGGHPDDSLLTHYKLLAGLRKATPVLTRGDLHMLLADDTAGTLAYGRKMGNQAAVVVINRGNQAQTVSIPVGGYLPDDVGFRSLYGVGNSGISTYIVTGGSLTINLNSMSAWVLVTGSTDLQPPDAPSGLAVTAEGSGQVSLAWQAVSGANGYNLYRSPLSGGGWVRVNASPLTGTTFTDTGLPNGQNIYYVVTALDGNGNESGYSGEVSALPHDTIGWANLQWPPTLTHTISVVDRTDNVYGQVWIDGVTNLPGATPTLLAQLGFGPSGSNPDGNPNWTWVDAGFNIDAGNNDEFVASLLPESTGSFDYAYRYSTTNGRDWIFADLDGIGNGYSSDQAGKLTVNPSDDTLAPAVPSGLDVINASPVGISPAWAAVQGDPSLYGYEVLRAGASGGPYEMLARVTGTDFIDTDVVEGATYYYVVRSVDLSFNRSTFSDEATATAELRTVSLVFNVTVPDTTDATGRNVYIAGFLDRLDGGLPQWDPGGVALTRVDATHYTITFTGKENVSIEYKYTLGDWDHVEKDGACGEIANRQLTLAYGASGVMTVADNVPNWRNVAPCGN